MTLLDIAVKLAQRLTSIFMKDRNGRRVVNGEYGKHEEDAYFRDLINFYEYYHGDTGKGLGASHQTGWTALVAEMIQWCWCD